MILLTGSRGRLGTELKKHITVKDFEGDFTKPFYVDFYDLVIHAGAYTDVFKAEVEPWKCINANVFGTYLLTQEYNDTPFVFISSEYAYNAVGVYSLSKYLGERIVKSHPHHLIIRTLFKPTPWPFEYAYDNQYTQGDYVDVIAKLIAEKITQWNKRTSETCYIGTGRKTMFELAQQTKPDVKPNKVTENFIPTDYL